MRYGLIAGNGRFPLLALEGARRLGHDVTVVAIQEEAAREVEAAAPRCHWISLGQLSKLIEILKEDGITEVMMTGQVKHAKIFSSIVPDWRLVKLLASLPSKNTDGLIGGVVRILEDEGIHLRDSTFLLKPLLATSGVMTRRKPDKDENIDIEYGRRVANALAGFDVGQSVAICEPGSDGRNRCYAAAGSRPGERAAAVAGEGGAAAGAPVVRRAHCGL
jgi:DUF1009 family protein